MKRKKTTGISKNILTKYYKAIYTNGDSEVFIDSSHQRIRRYHKGPHGLLTGTLSSTFFQPNGIHLLFIED